MTSRQDLLLRALAHECGNLLAAVRLSAYVLRLAPDEAETRSLAAEIEVVSLRAAALVALLRPLRDAEPLRPAALATADVLAALERAVALPEGAPNRIEVRVPRRAPALRAEADALHHALLSLVLAAAAGSPPPRHVRVSASAQGARLRIRVEDDGPAPEPVPRPPLLPRGRPLALALADAVLRRFGGRAALAPRRRGACVELWLRAAPAPRKGAGLSRRAGSSPRTSAAPLRRGEASARRKTTRRRR